jgi:glutathione synthase/RimK-type ligase-like ATP-grasp enzyme
LVQYDFNKSGHVAMYDGKELINPDVVWVRRTRNGVYDVLDLVEYYRLASVPVTDPVEALYSPLRKTMNLLRATGHLKVPKTMLHTSSQTDVVVGWDVFPAIIKPLEGYKGLGVSLVQDNSDLQSAAEALPGGYLVQEYLAERVEYRVTVIGGEVAGVHERICSSSHNVARNVARGNSLRRVDRPDLHKVAIDAAKRSGIDIAGVDLAETTDGLYLMEVNRNPGLMGLEVWDAVIRFLERLANGT